jgi:phthalate 4,5-dioxygenase reductase subunit
MDLVVTSRRCLCDGIVEFTLAAPDGGVLPPAEAGAHLTVETPSGAMRRYSLVRPDPAPVAYVIAIKREAASRGGSASMHDMAVVGHKLRADPPENSFPLARQGGALLIAGGIGITPIYAMAQQLAADGRPFRVIYCTRAADQTAYLSEMHALCGNALTLHHDDGDPARVIDFWDVFAEPTTEAVYCCGPAPLMDEVRAVSGHWPEGHVRFEDFKPVHVVRADDMAFSVTLSRTGQEIAVPADRSILEALRDVGIAVPSSCESGTCGTCKCRYLDGDVDHRDLVLIDEDRMSHIMLCVSRTQGGRLVLDL